MYRGKLIAGLSRHRNIKISIQGSVNIRLSKADANMQTAVH